MQLPSPLDTPLEAPPEDVLLEARIHTLPLYYGVCALLAYSLLCGGLILALQSGGAAISLVDLRQAYDPINGVSAATDAIAEAHPALRWQSEALGFITQWPFTLVMLTGVVCLSIGGVIITRKMRLAITTQRLAAQFGPLCRNHVELIPRAVKDISFTQPFWGRIFGFGSVHIHDYLSIIATVDYVRSPEAFHRHATTLWTHLPTPETAQQQDA